MQQFLDELYRVELPSDGSLKPGSLQLLRALTVKGKNIKETREIIKSLEEICKGEAMVGMELYPQDDGTDTVRKGAESLNILRGPNKYRIKDSELSSGTWNYRIMPTYHPLFAMNIRELSRYIPQKWPVPYMLTIGTDMKSDSVLLLGAWAISHPQLMELARTMEEGKGDLSFPGIYLGRKAGNKFLQPYDFYRLAVLSPVLAGASIVPYLIYLQKLSEDPIDFFAGGVMGGSVGGIISLLLALLTRYSFVQTNLYAGLMNPELSPPEDFIHMSGVLAKAYTKERSYFESFREGFNATLKEVGLDQNVIPRIKTISLSSDYGGRHFPDIAEVARTLHPEVADHIWLKVQQSVRELEERLYKPEELALIDRAYSGQLI